MKLLGLAIIIGLCFISSSAQTANDLSAKYGAAHQSYEIRPGIFITVKFAADGRVCEMWLEKRHVQASGTIGLDPTTLSPEETKPIIQELIPLSERGNETKSSGLNRISGIGGDTLEDYENVSITYIWGVNQRESGTAAVVIRWKNRGCN
jgi:hypothetical protein